jgi:hypothetical protein
MENSLRQNQHLTINLEHLPQDFPLLRTSCARPRQRADAELAALYRERDIMRARAKERHRCNDARSEDALYGKPENICSL